MERVKPLIYTLLGISLPYLAYNHPTLFFITFTGTFASVFATLLSGTRVERWLFGTEDTKKSARPNSALQSTSLHESYHRKDI